MTSDDALDCLPHQVCSFFSSSAWIAFFAGGGPPFKFVEFHPGPFRQMREAEGVHPSVYLASLLSGGQVWMKGLWPWPLMTPDDL